MTNTDRRREHLKKLWVSEWVTAALEHSGMPGAELARRMTAEGFKMERSAVSKMATGGRSASAEELAAIARITRYEEYRDATMTDEEQLPHDRPPSPAPSSRSDGDREVGVFDIESLRQALIAALMSPGARLHLAQQLAQDWLESARISSPNQKGE